MIYKALHGMKPGNLKDHLSLVTSTSPIKPGERGKLWILSIKECHLMEPRRRAFSPAKPALWHHIPLEVRSAPTLLAFQKAMKQG